MSPQGPSLVPAKTRITVRTVEPIKSGSVAEGQELAATLDEPIVVGNATIADIRTPAVLRVESSTSAGKFSGRAALALRLVGLDIGGQRVPIETGDATTVKGGSKTGKAAAGFTVSAAVATAICKGRNSSVLGLAICIGSVTAGGGLTVAELISSKVDIPAETRFSFTTAKPTSLAPLEAPGQGPTPGGGGPLPPQPPAPVLVQSADGLRVQVERCEREGTQSVTCFFAVRALNKDIDRLIFGAQYCGGGGTQMVDSAGISQRTTSVNLGSSTGEQAVTPLVQDVTVKGHLEFRGVERGVDRVAKLELGYAFSGCSAVQIMTFRNIPLESPNAKEPEPPTRPPDGRGPDPQPPSDAVKAEGFTVRLSACYRQATAAVFCKFTVTNQKADRRLVLQSAQIVDSEGLQQNALSMKLGSAAVNSTQVDAVYDVAIPGEVKFGGVTPRVTSLAKLTLTFGSAGPQGHVGFDAVHRGVPLPVR